MLDNRFNPDGLALSADYARTMNEVVLPAINARRRDLTILVDGGKPLFASRFDAKDARGTVLIVHGFTENAHKFSELIHSLLTCGFSVLAYDQRGHGAQIRRLHRGLRGRRRGGGRRRRRVDGHIRLAV